MKKTKTAKMKPTKTKQVTPVKYLVTSALPYVNNVPHLGNIIGCVLSADVFARYLRSRKRDVLYICATDEYGTTTEAKAHEEGLTPRQVCDKYHAIHKQVYDWFGISFDHFGRTSHPSQTEITQGIFLSLYKNGCINEHDVEQSYCRTCDKFLADRFIEGTCPHCKYQQARGDQCEHCGKLLNPLELVESRCKICGSPPEVKKSRHLFLNLPKLEPELKAWFSKASQEGEWPENAKQFTEAWFKEGLKERCITRDLKWGVPVPLRGFENKVFYVWFDAPIGYISATKQCTDASPVFGDWKDWWLPSLPSNKKVLYYEFMAKDNIPFHTILFPSSLIGTREVWTLPHHISSVEYLNYEDGKFSKSKGTGVFGDHAIDSGIPPDIWRFYLLINRPEQADTLFHWKDFQNKINTELLANLGNFVNRTLVFCHKHYGGKVPNVSKAKLTGEDKAFFGRIENLGCGITGFFERVKIKDALKLVMEISHQGNQYFQNQEPWRLVKGTPEEQAHGAVVVGICVNLARTLAVLIEPYLPFTAKEIFRQLNLEYDKLPLAQREKLVAWDHASDLLVPEGHQINTPNPLFQRLEDVQIAVLRDRFRGKSTSPLSTRTAAAPDKAELITLGQLELFKKLDLRVAKIIDVKKHPNADNLLIEKILLGSGQPQEQRQIVSGIAEHYPDLRELVGKQVVVVANLKPVKLRGELSQGMLLVCVEAGVDSVLEAPGNSGDQLFFDKPFGAPKEIMIDDFEKVRMIVKNNRVYVEGGNLPLRSSSGEVASVLASGRVA